MSALLIPGTSTVLAAKIHPVVIYSICDSYIRRNADQDRVIGTLLGSVGSDGVVDVRSCFTVIHSEQDGEVRLECEWLHGLEGLRSLVSMAPTTVLACCEGPGPLWIAQLYALYCY